MKDGLGQLAIIVVNYGSHELIEQYLGQTVAGTPDLRVYVVDNPTTHTERADVERLCSDRGWRVLTPSENCGFGGGINLGAAAAIRDGADVLLLLNPDASIDAESLRLLRGAVAADPKAVVAPRILTPDGRVWFDGVDLHLRDGSMRSSRKRRPGDDVFTWLTAACLLVPVELWETVAGFESDEYFMYWEDVDLSWRLVQAGAHLSVVSEATAVHEEGGTQQDSGRAKSRLYYYSNIRNRMVFARRNLDSATQRRWACLSLSAAGDVLLRGGRRQLLSRRSPIPAAVRGVVDGLVGLRDQPRRHPSDPRPEGGLMRVLQSFPEPRPTTNPYIVMLKESLEARPDIELRTFSWKDALTKRFDVFHAHWPEILVAGRTPTRKAIRQALFVAFLVRLRWNRTAIVRTQHNLELPVGITRRERTLLRAFERWTDLCIAINDTTPRRSSVQWRSIIHGHYRDWYGRYATTDPVRGRVAFVGMVRHYKNVDGLLRALAGTPRSAGLSLEIAGNPTSADLRALITDLAAADDRVLLRLTFIDDADFVRVVTASEVVILPYAEMHNSGTVLAALSLDRPVLVPDNEANRRLASEVGENWVLRYTGELRAEDITAAVVAGRRVIADGAVPDLRSRDWAHAAADHVEAYRAAALRRRSRRLS